MAISLSRTGNNAGSEIYQNLRDDESKKNIKGRSNLVFLGFSRAVDTTFIWERMSL